MVDQDGRPWATSYFYAPFHLRLKRVSKETGTSKFISTFYVCPVGVGRSRFMAGVCANVSFPRWLAKLNTDNFLDQDTYLLATQQRYILSQEARDIQQMLETDTSSTLQSKSMKTRRNMFCLTSPTERIGSRLEQFWDATLLRVPNRVDRLLQLNAVGAFATVSPREVVLDRETQQTNVCRDSQGALKNCKRISKYSKLVGVATIIAKSMDKTPKALGSPIGLTSTLTLCFLSSYLARKMEKEFYFKYTDDYRKRDLAKIPEKIWLDKD